MPPRGGKPPDLVSELLARIPEIRVAYQRERRWWGGETPGDHIIFGDVLTPHITRLLELERDEDALRRIFEFLEKLAGDPDESIRDVVAQSVIERLTDNEHWLRAAKPYMGRRTKDLVRKAGRFWGIPYAKAFR